MNYTDKNKKRKSEKAQSKKVSDTATSRYYKTVKGGGPEAAIAKRQMENYFSPAPHNKRGESHEQHMKRMSKRERDNRRALGYKKKQ